MSLPFSLLIYCGFWLHRVPVSTRDIFHGMVLFVFEMPESGYSRSNISIEFFIINCPTGAKFFAAVKTFDTNTENIGNFVLM